MKTKLREIMNKTENGKKKINRKKEKKVNYAGNCFAKSLEKQNTLTKIFF